MKEYKNRILNCPLLCEFSGGRSSVFTKLPSGHYIAQKYVYDLAHIKNNRYLFKGETIRSQANTLLNVFGKAYIRLKPNKKKVSTFKSRKRIHKFKKLSVYRE